MDESRTDQADEAIDVAAAILQALSLPLRLRIVLLVLEEEATAGEISTTLGTTNPTLAHHLRHLRVSGVLQRRRIGNHVLYRTAPLIESLIRQALACAQALAYPDNLPSQKRRAHPHQ